MYNENSSQKQTDETDKTGGVRKVVEKDMKKDVIYEEKNGSRIPISQTIIRPKIEGAIITAEGADDINIKNNIIEAVEAVTGIAKHKIQVFTLEDNT